jgi:hypothetical protein
MFDIREWFETEKSKQNAEWANKVIRFIRMNAQPLVSLEEAEEGMSYLLGKQDMSFIRALFQDTTRMNLTNEGVAKRGIIVNAYNQPISAPVERHEGHEDFLKNEMSLVNFKPLPIMEKLRNVLISEMKKMGVVLDVRSEDPTSFAKKIKDRDILENKGVLEGLMSYCYTALGQRPYKLKDHKARFGENAANGNIDQFESMGLDSKDPTDINFFMENFHKLDEEIAAEAPINFCMTYNRVLQEFEKWVNDIIAKKAVAATCYVSDVTGAIMYKYLAPETVWIYGGGNEQHFNDANAKFYQRKVTIKEMLDVIGNKFDFEQQWDNLLRAVSTCNGMEFTGVGTSYRGLCNGDTISSKSGAKYGMSDFMSLRVTLGYIEFSTQNNEAYGGVAQESKSYYEDNQTTLGKYATKAKWETPTYKAYYLAITDVEQVLFDFGEVSFQDIEGATDLGTNFTIITWKEIGDPIAIIAAPFLDIMNEAWYKFRYELRRAKPRGRGWNYDAMISNLMNLIPDNNISGFGKLQKVMEMLDSSANEVWTWPIGPDGKAIAIPGNQLNYDIPGGLTKETLGWWQILIDVGEYLSSLIGISPLREGDPGNPRDSMNNQFKALEYSQAATYYVPDSLSNLLQQLSIRTGFYVQDIINYKEYNSMAYKFLEDGVGEEKLNKLAKMGKTAMHRFGIFVESINQGPMRQKLEALMFEAVKNKTISTAEYMLVSDIKSTKQAFITFAFFEQRNKRLEQQAQAALSKQQQEAQMALKEMEFKIEMLKQQGGLAQENIKANAVIQHAIINQQGGLAKTNIKVSAGREQVYHQAQANLYEQQQTMNDTGKTTAPFPAPVQQQQPQQPGMQQQPGGYQPQPINEEESAAAQLRKNAEPMPSESAM